MPRRVSETVLVKTSQPATVLLPSLSTDTLLAAGLPNHKR
jgi:hypothetical protein